MADDGGDKLSRSQKRLRREYLRHAATREPQAPPLDESNNLTFGLEDIPMDTTLSVDSDIVPPPSTPIHLRHVGGQIASGGDTASTSKAVPPSKPMVSRPCKTTEDTPLPSPTEELLVHYEPDTPTAPQPTADKLSEPLRPDVVNRLPDVDINEIDDSIQTHSSHVQPSAIPDPDTAEMSWVQWSVDTEAVPFDTVNFVPEAVGEDHIVPEMPEEHFSEDFQIKENSPLFEGAKITQWDSLTAILSYAQSEHTSGAGLSRLINLISLHLPDPNIFFKSSNHLFKMLEKIDDPVQMHYFCSICYKTRLTSSELCDVCVDSCRKVNYFISVPLAVQLKKMLKRPDFVTALKHKNTRDRENENNIEDIFDGAVYKDAEKSTPFSLSLMWNTDGVQIFNSSSFSLWPFYFVINELPPQKRFLSENILIAGIWGSVTKPHPNVYLLPIYKDIQTLTKGFECDVYGVEEKCTVKVIVLCGTCDAPARALFLNMKSHSGFYSCPVCCCKGARVADTTVFPYQEGEKMRSKEDYKRQVQWAVENRVLHNKNLLNEEAACGIKGPSVLSYIVEDMFKSTSIDGMHCVFLGVTRQVLNLLTDKDNREEPYSVYYKMHLVSEKMLQILPPHFLQRLPQSLEKLVLWKASELRSFLLYYALCVLRNLLNQVHYDHLMLLVEGIALLYKSSISENDIRMSSLLLSQFVSEFKDMYGPRNMSHNLHMLVHLPRNVQNLGPLWATSCFKFEDMNGRLTNLVHGTRHAGLQIYSHLSVVTQLPLMINKLENKTVQTYCNQLFRKGKPLNFNDKISPGVYCIGNMTDLNANFDWIVNKLLESYNIVVQASSIKLFHRLLKHSLLYVSTSYKASKRVSSFVKYRDSDNNVSKYGVVQTFARVKSCNCTDVCDCSADYVAVIKPLELTPSFRTDTVTVHHIYSILPSNLPEEIVYVECLSTVLFKIDVDDTNYIAEPLNKYELE